MSRAAPPPAAGWPREIALDRSPCDGYELRLRSLFDEGSALAFPCDAPGHVELDAMSPHARLNDLYARTVIGTEDDLPDVQPRTTMH